jgi:predicted alpha/beta hydrolase
MGCSQDYYRPFASWLATQGFVAATFDYRGTGFSRPRTLRGFKADILDWARLDCAAMIDALPERPLYWIGHSLGGQILALTPNQKAVTKAVTVATGSGYWRENTPRIRPAAWWLWFVVTPLAVSLCGYFPGKALRKVGDLPKGVMQQWRRWCLNREYAVGVEGDAVRALYAAVRTPIVSLSFSDDEMMSLRNTESIHGFYSGAPRASGISVSSGPFTSLRSGARTFCPNFLEFSLVALQRFGIDIENARRAALAAAFFRSRLARRCRFFFQAGIRAGAAPPVSRHARRFA